jgi:hypothetical protein
VRMGTYNYQPLQKANEIRLLDLLPGLPNAPLKCQLRHAVLDDSQLFEALSYVWGNPKASHTAEVNDGAHVSITASLHSALSRLRLRNELRTIWADGICINQTDLKERGSQVKLMRKVYRQATSVIIDIGVEQDDSETGIALAHKLVAASQTGSEGGQDTSDVPDLEDKAWAAFRALIQRPWFTRVWMIQELALSRSSTMICGTQVFGGDVLYKALRVVFENGLFTNDPKSYTNHAYNQEVTRLVSSSHRVVYLYQIRDRVQEQDSFAADVQLVLQRNTVLNATDPRDYVFGILALINGNDVLNISPDYTQDIATVYVQSMSAVAAYDHNTFVRTLYSVGAPTNITSMPSWVPDWSVQTEAFSYEAVRFRDYEEAPWRSEPFSDIFISEDMKSLRVSAFVVDEITSCGYNIHAALESIGGELLQRRYAMREWIKAAETIAANTLDEDRYSDFDRQDACWRTLTGGADPRQVVVNTSLVNSDDSYLNAAEPEAVELWHAFKKYLAMEGPLEVLMQEKENQAIIAKASNFFTWAKFFGKGRKMVATRRGMLGLMPVACVEGDVTIIIPGATAPFVARRSKDGYRLIGHGYLHELREHTKDLNLNNASYTEIVII